MAFQRFYFLDLVQRRLSSPKKKFNNNNRQFHGPVSSRILPLKATFPPPHSSRILLELLYQMSALLSALRSTKSIITSTSIRRMTVLSTHARPILANPELFREQGYINGEFVSAKSGKTFEVTDPATLEKIGVVPEFDVEDLRSAIDSASVAYHEMKKTTGRQRARWLRAWYELMIENQEDLAKLITWENGKILEDAQKEIAYSAGFFEWFSEEAPRLYGDTIPSAVPGNRIFTVKQPIGVAGIITPWNFPAGMITRKVGAAVAAGCSVVVKPAAETPYSAIALAVLAEKAGVPKGVYNVVTSHVNTRAFGTELCENKTIKKVSFTGSTPVGKILMGQSSSTLKKLSFELGGNAPFVVFEDADVDVAVEAALPAKYRGNGQTCVCPNRFFVHETVYDEFAEKLAARVAAHYHPGFGFNEGSTLGPLINEAAVNKVDDHVKDAVSKNAKILTGGKRLPELGPNFYAATVIRDVTPEMKINTEETFGPLIPIMKFTSEADVIARANSVEVGLAGYFFSKDVARVYRVAEALETGMVGVNTAMISEPALPFGGIKQSGFGLEGSKYGVEEYLVKKTVVIGGIN